MKVLSTIAEITAYTADLKKAGRTIGLVPTMGALHEGHLTLMRAAKAENDVVIASVFVNPIQFGPKEDYDKYPREFEADCAKLESVKVDAVFHPELDEMYPPGFCTYVNVDGDLTRRLCGASRPGHFRGVATVVTRLMNLSRADRAYFGQKDAQQVCVIKRLVSDLGIPVQVVMVPISREDSGLARSSRNVYLSDKEKKQALCLSRGLRKAEAVFSGGEKNIVPLMQSVWEELVTEPAVDVEYVKICDFPTLESIETVEKAALLAVAARIGKTRLIDNIIIG